MTLSGCQKGPHSNIKPEEPESITGKKDDRNLNDQLNDFAAEKQNLPLLAKLERPSFDHTPLVRLKPTKSASLKVPGQTSENGISDGKTGEVSHGESCKRGGCKAVMLKSIIKYVVVLFGQGLLNN